MSMNEIENDRGVYALGCAEQIDFIKRESGHGYYAFSGEQFLGIGREVHEFWLHFPSFLKGVAAD